MSVIRRRIAVLAGAVGLLAGSTVASASAAPPAPSCPEGWFCFWDGPNFQGSRGRLSDCGVQYLSTWGWGNRIESSYNNTNRTVQYSDATTGAVWFDAPYSAYGWVPVPNAADRVERLC
ncbi:peptidase inhibitor family I36 protein [Streptomyces roseirectus]|uniref:Peptidase inhibitor family I36 protein n=1 Tax=Streptomyces roseirectus TaxID=2768066 RepID=A0A7H0IPC5_9ACTN|nr:peptidase inhibitor family I36 protein [Streptomyces roseirectus]QNP74641.1 peptidase inhibitor family I36 protein [Streptomyces roseirectus]